MIDKTWKKEVFISKYEYITMLKENAFQELRRITTYVNAQLWNNTPFCIFSHKQYPKRNLKKKRKKKKE